MIYIPSYKRAGICKSPYFLKQAVLCVAKSEADEYRAKHENKVLEIPDELNGKGMATIRQWIVDNAFDDKVLMIDDMVEGIGYYEAKKAYEFSEQQVYDLHDEGFRMAREVGTCLWGMNLLQDKQAYREYSPFSLSSVVLGTFMAVIRNPLKFDVNLGLKEDFDYSLQVLNKHRKILRFNKYHYKVKHIIGQGGCRSYRTKEKEDQQKEAFIRKWGSKIVKFKDGDLNPIVTIPITGI